MQMLCEVLFSNMISGLQQHTSKFPCGWCYGTHPFPGGAALRKVGELKKLAEDFNDPEGNKGNKKFAMNYFNVVRPPLLDVDDETLVMDVVPLGELHLFLGT